MFIFLYPPHIPKILLQCFVVFMGTHCIFWTSQIWGANFKSPEFYSDFSSYIKVVLLDILKIKTFAIENMILQWKTFSQLRIKAV